MVNAIGNQYAASRRNYLAVAMKAWTWRWSAETFCCLLGGSWGGEQGGGEEKQGESGPDSLCEERNFLADRSHQDWVRGRDVDKKEEKKGGVVSKLSLAQYDFTTNSFQTKEQITPGS